MPHRRRSPGRFAGLAAVPDAVAREHPREQADVIIAGDGIIALAAGVALRSSLGEEARIVMLAPPAPRGQGVDPRAYAIASSARHMLETLGVWRALENAAQPMKRIIVTDSRLDDVVRPAFLSFLGEAGANENGGSEAFAHMIEAQALRDALLYAAETARIEKVASRVDALGLDSEDERILVSAEAERIIAASLLVAADGARSVCRELAGIAWIGWDYPQLGLTTTIGHEREHDGRAYEHFLPGGPFAILPLKGRRSSIVWAEDKHEAKRLLSLAEAEVLTEIARRFGHELGDLRLEGRLIGFPLGFGIARAFAGRRLALVGDAAHVIHPVAGQGLNLGLQDVAGLAEAVSEAAHLGLDPGNPHTLSSYERARRFDTTVMGALTDGLVRLFSNDFLPLRALRDIGLSLVDRAPVVKRFLAAKAGGQNEIRSSRSSFGRATRLSSDSNNRV
ncbi:MAG: FAD-dependent monooxygenase [Hyphomicrobiales bacterium]|nr:FAD-dependent monooxygenase [Hyphomicrobiales bacterium]